jgi:hypothetical protein
MDYDDEIEKEARDFIIEHEDMFVEALKNDSDWDYNDIDDLDSCWHDDIVDRAYTLDDAAYILDNCHEEETDSGLWDGRDAQEAMSARAAYSYANDVWFKAEEMYNEIKERMKELVDEDEDEETSEEISSQTAFDEFKNDNGYKIVPVEKGSEEEISLIRQWLLRNDRDAGMRGGYPVGGSYIDSRCGTGHGIPDVKDYVDFDHEFAQRVPWLSGKYKDVVQKRYDYLMDLNRTLEEVHYSELDTMDTNVRSLRSMISGKILVDCRLKVSDIREIIRDLERGV